MSKIKELQAQVTALQMQATRANNERETWHRIAQTRATDLQTLYKRLDAQAEQHQKDLVTTAKAMAEESVRIMKNIRHESELELIAAQRDSLGQAYKYLVDSVTANK